jgi:hypothetical protein
MKKSISVMSIILALTLVVSMFVSTVAFAADTEPTTFTFSDGFEELTTIEKNAMGIYEVGVSNPELTITATSSNEAVLSIDMDAEGYEGYYAFALMALEDGDTTLTFTASDGTTFSQKLTVEGTKERNFTISADTTHDFTLVKGNSYFMKIHFTSEDENVIPVPLLISKEDAITTKLVDIDFETGDYIYRVDAVGNVGQFATLFMGSIDTVPLALCKVTITANKNLRLDTTSEYLCNSGDTYRFVAYTTSTTAPKASTNNNMTSVEYLRKVSGGYEYRVKALKAGDSLVKVTLNGETASFPVSINFLDMAPIVTSDTNTGVKLANGASYTYKITAVGGGEPNFIAGTGGVVSVQLLKKDGIDYYYKVTAVGKTNAATSMYVTFPQSGNKDYDVSVGTVSVTGSAPVIMKSDTYSNFSVKLGASYQFKITGAANFYPGTSGVFDTKLISKSGNDSFYRITAVGQPGQITGFYMSTPGQQAQKVCMVTVGAAQSTTPVTIQSDTNSDFSIKEKAGYQFKITAPGAASIHFSVGTPGAFGTSLVKHVGNDFYYKVTAIGHVGQASGIYVSVPGQAAKKLCVVSIS